MSIHMVDCIFVYEEDGFVISFCTLHQVISDFPLVCRSCQWHFNAGRVSPDRPIWYYGYHFYPTWRYAVWQLRFYMVQRCSAVILTVAHWPKGETPTLRLPGGVRIPSVAVGTVLPVGRSCQSYDYNVSVQSRVWCQLAFRGRQFDGERNCKTTTVLAGVSYRRGWL